MNKEFEFLKIISDTLSDSTYLGDDCAYLDEYKLAISKDCLIEDVHFSFSFMTPYEIARKSVLVNVSDILASGAKPKYILVGLSGKLDEKFIREFYQGVNDTIEKYNIKLIGGDLTKGDKISVSITILGDYKNRNVSSRKNAKIGYIVATIGEFGSSAKGLEDLKKGIEDNYFIQYHKNPPLDENITSKIATLAKNPYAMMDSSDGLFDCLYQIASKSKVRIDIDYSLIPKKVENRNLVLFGGEDYCPLVCLSDEDFKKINGLIKIGVVKEGSGVYIDNEKVEYRGFEHFE